MPLDLSLPAVCCRVFNEFLFNPPAATQTRTYSGEVTNLAQMRNRSHSHGLLEVSPSTCEFKLRLNEVLLDPADL
jgi:hypothetical protein